MAKKPERTTELSPRSIRELRVKLEAYVELVKEAEAYDASVWAFRVPSLNEGMKRLRSFMQDFKICLDDLEAGRPYSAETTKSEIGPQYGAADESEEADRVSKEITRATKKQNKG